LDNWAATLVVVAMISVVVAMALIKRRGRYYSWRSARA
jgi:hypothetical protein